MGTTRKYWKGIEELNQTPEFIQSRDQEFPRSTSVDEFLGDENLRETSTDRRDFLKFLGFSVAAATVAACEAPVTKVIPYVIKPENVTPGMATWYASTYYDGASYASILVKTREGRPIFIKGNRDYGFTAGAVNPQIVASVLPLYDAHRLRDPKAGGASVSDWRKDIDNPIKQQLASIAAKKGKVVMVSNTIISPSTLAAIDTLRMKVNGGDAAGTSFEHIQYDPVSYAGIRKANEVSFGMPIIPDYDFSKAKTIVSVGADFMNGWLISNEYTHQYSTRRNPDADWMSKHFQFESNLSVAGSNADYRGMIKPSEQANVLAYLLGKFGVNTGVSTKLDAGATQVADLAFESLKKSKKESLVVCSSNNVAVQTLVNKLNAVLGAYEVTINVNNPVNMFASQDEKMNQFVQDVIGGKNPDAVIFYATNPVYTHPNGLELAKAIKNIGLSVSLSQFEDETAKNCKFIAPDHNMLEAWNDYNPKKNHFSIAQPTIRPLFNTAQAQESFLIWGDTNNVYERGGKDSKVAYDFIRATWGTALFASQTKITDADSFWNKTIHDSCYQIEGEAMAAPAFNDAALSGISSNLPAAPKGDYEVVLYQKSAIGLGLQVNPWLHEMADSISKVTWDNYITMNPTEMEKGKYKISFDQEHGLNIATVKIGNKDLYLPVYPSPGQAIGTVGIALGYGRGENDENIGNAAFVTKEYGGFAADDNGNRVPVGKNAYRFVSFENGTYNYNLAGSVTKEKSDLYPIAATQIHHTVMARHSIVKETTLDIYKSKGKEAYNPSHMIATHEGAKPVSEFDLWDAHPVKHVGHRWGMTIDLNNCIGCGACLIACQVENNVPVVGKDEVRRAREMAWLRIDRYYSSDEEATIGLRKDKDTFSYHKAEVPVQNPKVVHMPMMCQHCNHASCETVCPVAATNHSNEGLNQMAYNRCIGTRYCANNCPYKVRRFNWFNYPSYKKFTQVNPSQDDLGRMVLNPDVTVRTRGVMEKCSFCVQKIQSGKLVAKKEGRPVVDGDVNTACAEVCPSNAITVGDWNDVTSMVRKSSEETRAYQVLEEIGMQPNVWYKTKVRNEKNALLETLQVDKKVVAHNTTDNKH